MASPNSFFSSSSASKCTVITPRNSPVDEYFQTRSASSLSHSPGEGPFAGWGALPTHLLDSPEPAKLLTFRGTEAIARCNVQAMDDLRKKLRASLSSTPDLDNRDLVSGEPGFDYGSRSNSTNSSYRDVSLGHQSPAGGVLGSLRYSHDQLSSPLSSHTPRNHMEAQQIEVQASRVLKISGIPLEATSLLLFDKLSEFGDIRDIYTKDILPDGFCVVRYFDQGDAIRAFGALHLEEDVGVQYCPEGYLSMISLGGGDDRLELTCVVYSGGWLRRSYRKVFHVLSIFGALCRFANVEGSRPPTFLSFYYGVSRL
ncbi:hypothetical protein L873DRAFT_539945 [Choiromyces venosus 120613-1]|uniref:RRM domain-containing protein n=1 Tax=Choiromyces venosus 120613-1 TaxID=1336337 RepID=A0A3N4K5E3_9PEZI|nr:hypothetical protein L873DRAFT_539945 [Choiromyces venosus 120613-1]